ncbi:hypothetical protein BGX38DRAFT_1279335 [Terfezia claveryi]|nr:hypothetical protein BGX38DRAFT_1279335 [Terfezia claveryi]
MEARATPPRSPRYRNTQVYRTTAARYLYGVERTILRRRVLGTHQDRSIAHQIEQLFSTGEEKAIADYAGVMADAGFPLNPDLLQQIVQGIVNERQIPQQSQGGGIVGPQQLAIKPHDQRNQRIQRQGTIPASTSTSASASTSASTTPPIHIVGIHWVDRFLERNLGFKKVYIQYQERARAAATNDIELQADFLRKLTNLV